MATETSRLPAESNVADPLGPLPRRVLVYIAWVAVCCLALLHPVTAFISYSLSNDNASHLILIPAISAWILFLERGKIFKFLGSDSKIAAVFLFAGVAVALFALTLASSWSSLNRLSIYIFALVLLWIAGFAFIFGRTAFSNAQFPLAFLLLTIPIPDYFLDRAIYFLQKGSTEISAILFDWSGVPVLRDGFVFHLAHVNIEVARECSGIRSSLALLILAILVAHFYLETFWKQVVVVLAGLAMMIVKNGVRIVTLTLLASYVDPGFLYGRLHHEGGVVFFLLGLALLAPVLWLLERSEPKRTAPRAS
jgi:exosortase